MNPSPPPLSPCSVSTHHTSQSSSTPSTTPLLPHSIIAAAHCLAPLDDLHLAHLINQLKPTLPVWSIHDHHPSLALPTPLITSNDRLRSDELADLPAPEAERLHAAYDIEDYLDSTPDRLLVYGPSTPVLEILGEVRDLLINKNRTHSTRPLHLSHHASSSSSYEQSNQTVYVARIFFQPNDGPERSYKWEPGGPDLIRFELVPQQTLLPHHHQPIIINWSPVELALSQALEVGHQLLALLHSRQFAEVLSTLDVLNEFRPINPIVWLVDPVEYAHAQLRETTEWGWSEHHVELSSPNYHQPIIRSIPSIHPNSNSTSASIARDFAHPRPLSKSHLSHELYLTDDDHEQHHEPRDSPKSFGSTDSNRTIHSTSLSQREQYHPSRSLKNLADDLPNWLNDLLDRRLPRLLSLPDGCLSYELLNSSHPSNTNSQHIPCNVASNKKIPSIIASPPEKNDAISPDRQSSLIKLGTNSKWSTLSALASPTRAFLIDQRSLASSVPAFDQHHLLSPSITNSLRHVQTNTLKYYPCKACSEHAFKLALSHKLNEEKRRLVVGGPNKPGANSLSLQLHHHPRRGSQNMSQVGAVESERRWSGELADEGEWRARSAHAMLPLYHPKLAPHSSHPAPVPRPDGNGHSHPPSAPKLDDLPAASPYPVIGLGLKGKAIKEAMDREHDAFISHQQSLSSFLGIHSHALASEPKHTWDEGEVIED